MNFFPKCGLLAGCACNNVPTYKTICLNIWDLPKYEGDIADNDIFIFAHNGSTWQVTAKQLESYIGEISGDVTGVKGAVETSYRSGEVDLTLPDITNLDSTTLEYNSDTKTLKAKGAVSGVKGNTETDYRTGSVNLTLPNLVNVGNGLKYVENTNNLRVNISDASGLYFSENESDLGALRVRDFGRYVKLMADTDSPAYQLYHHDLYIDLRSERLTPAGNNGSRAIFVSDRAVTLGGADLSQDIQGYQEAAPYTDVTIWAKQAWASADSRFLVVNDRTGLVNKVTTPDAADKMGFIFWNNTNQENEANEITQHLTLKAYNPETPIEPSFVLDPTGALKLGRGVTDCVSLYIPAASSTFDATNYSLIGAKKTDGNIKLFNPLASKDGFGLVKIGSGISVTDGEISASTGPTGALIWNTGSVGNITNTAPTGTDYFAITAYNKSYESFSVHANGLLALGGGTGANVNNVKLEIPDATSDITDDYWLVGTSKSSVQPADTDKNIKLFNANIVKYDPSTTDPNIPVKNIVATTALPNPTDPNTLYLIYA